MSNEKLGSNPSGQDPSLALGNVQPIGFSSGVLIGELSQLDALVEAPALPACRNFYTKNIRTTSASANVTNAESAYIDIDYQTLSEENKKTAREVGTPLVWKVNENGAKSIMPASDQDSEDSYVDVKLEVPVTAADNEESVARKLFDLSETFAKQKLGWGMYSLEQIKKEYGYGPDEKPTSKDFMGEGYYYDPKTQLFYLSQELYKKSRFF